MASDLPKTDQFTPATPPNLEVQSVEMGRELPTSPNVSDEDQAQPCTSSSSSSTGSYTSTIKYDQEPYDLFAQRVDKLCQILWPQQRSIKYRFLESKIAIALRANNSFRSLIPLLQPPLMKRLPGGDYNRITAITLPPSYSVDYHKLILRVPREERARPDREVALLSYVRNRTSIPVAHIAAKDFSCDNPLNKPNVLQHRIPGTDLGLVWDDLSHNQRLVVARRLGDVVRQLLSLESPVAGTLEARSDHTEIAEPPLIVPFELRDQDGSLRTQRSAHLVASELYRLTMVPWTYSNLYSLFGASGPSPTNLMKMIQKSASGMPYSKLCVRWTHCSCSIPTQIVYATSIYTLATSWSSFDPTIISKSQASLTGTRQSLRQSFTTVSHLGGYGATMLMIMLMGTACFPGRMKSKGPMTCLLH